MPKTPASDLLRTMSHELRTPLNGIIGYAQLLLRDKTLNQRQVTGISAILESGDQLLALINTLVDLARAEAGESELVPVEVSLRGLIAGVMEVARARARQKGLEITCDIAAGLPELIHVDIRCLRQVLTNLLDNAVRFTDEGRVVLRVDRERAGQLGFSVQDTGRVPGEATRVKDGGLGLALSREFVRLMGGELRVSSEPGVGSTFQFDIASP
jgi:signal transduction histidine kinase